MSTSESLTDGDLRPRARRAAPWIGAGAAGIAVAMAFWRANSRLETIIVVAVVLVVTAGLYAWLVPMSLRRPATGRPALVLSIVALALLLPAFWSGLPMVLGAAGALLGAAGRNAAVGHRAALVAMALGLVAVLGYLAIYVYDYVATA